jgi:EAL domain-containing protein (putative c-di-GMP-specific phosphodiesterase class I)
LEALCRVVARGGKIISAADFHDAASDILIASELTQRMIAQVARDVRGWRDMGVFVKQVGINVTSSDFCGGKLPEQFARAFQEAGVPLANVGIEITESVYLNGRDEAVSRQIHALRELGITVALDDFGTGHASLTHLLTVPLDMIKIDKSFIDGMQPGNTSFAIVKGLIAIAGDLGIRVVAEGVETPLQAVQLRSIDCPLAQGFHFARPADRRAITWLLVQTQATAPTHSDAPHGPSDPKSTANFSYG